MCVIVCVTVCMTVCVNVTVCVCSNGASALASVFEISAPTILDSHSHIHTRIHSHTCNHTHTHTHTSSQVVLDASSVLMRVMLSSSEPVALDSRARMVSSSSACEYIFVCACVCV